ncbi:N-acetyltransferase [Anaerotruncus massiliensis (ex Liu et al. 2021)]|uniref:N-acetyltransferase n=1 Tax=Anaerotruncus massiliensis (ex Liu et al. 2021) TaxID=2321404 RepID=A0A498CKP3_9FIRM|nr:N-acetyltransferase [Anaerotruncus massiliensis (ex Liu et al. 2021)]
MSADDPLCRQRADPTLCGIDRQFWYIRNKNIRTVSDLRRVGRRARPLAAAWRGPRRGRGVPAGRRRHTRGRRCGGCGRARRLPRSLGCRSYEGERALCERVNAVIRGGLRSSRILRWGGRSAPADARPAAAAPCANGVPPGIAAPAEDLGAVYALLCAADPAFTAQADYAAWLTEVSHKRRHGLADIYILKVDNRIVSTIGIYFKDASRAILAGLATNPACRGRGYARRMMAHATNAALAQGLEPWLLTAEDGIAAFHRACGYRDAGFWSKGNFRESSL